MKSEEQIWDDLKSAKVNVLKWVNNEGFPESIHDIHFIPITPKELEVYVFYELDSIVKRANENGRSESIKARFLNEMSNIDSFHYGNSVFRFYFDSHENVLKNYKGSYFFRLR